MNTLKNADLSKFRNGEFLEFINVVNDFYKRVNPTQKILVKRLGDLSNALQTMDASFSNNMEESLISGLKPLDVKRMDNLKGLKRFLQSELYRPEEARKRQATLLLKSFDQFGSKMRGLTLPHKTLLIRKLLEEWSQNNKLTEAIQNLGATSWVEALTELNIIFYDEYFNKATATTKGPGFKSLRKDITKIYQELMKDTESVARVEDDNAMISGLIQEMNGIIEMATEPIQNRKGKRKTEKVPDASPPAPVLEISENPFGI